MAGRFDVDATTTGYGSVGGAGIRSLQTELLRRAQQEEADRLEAAKIAQLAVQNQRQAQMDAVTQQVALENVASNRASREATAAARDAATLETQRKGLTGRLRIGKVLSPGQKTELDKVGLADLYTSKTEAANNGLPGQQMTPAADGSFAPTPGVETSTYTGTPEQQQQQEREAAIAGLLSGETKVDRSDPLAMETFWKKIGGTGPLPAGVVVPKATAAETESQHSLKMKELKARVLQGYVPSKAEAADLKVYDDYVPTTAQKNAEARQHIQITVDAANARQQNTFVNGAVEKFKTRLAAENKDLEKDLERVDRATALLSRPSFVADSVAAPEFLQIVAGGMGSGLRMTDAELNRVNKAQTWLAQKRGELAKLPGASLLGVDQTTIGQEMRAKMAEILEDVKAARERKAVAEELAMHRISSAKSTEEATQIEEEYWQQKRAGAKMTKPGAAAAAPKTGGYTVTVR